MHEFAWISQGDANIATCLVVCGQSVRLHKFCFLALLFLQAYNCQSSLLKFAGLTVSVSNAINDVRYSNIVYCFRSFSTGNKCFKMFCS